MGWIRKFVSYFFGRDLLKIYKWKERKNSLRWAENNFLSQIINLNFWNEGKFENKF